MDETQYIQHNIEKAVLSSAEVSAIIADYQRNQKHDKDRAAQVILYELTQVSPFFVNLDFKKFKVALDGYNF
jgi:hypothetical protein